MALKQVVIHTPGPNWKSGANFREQSEDIVIEHVAHYREFHRQGKLLLGGPFEDIDTGGLMIADENVSREELEKFAASDPAVQKGLLNYEVKTWYVAMSK